MTDWVKVLPGDDPAQTARDLLSLAESKHDVRTSSDEGLLFVVPAYLAEAYQAAMSDITLPVVVPEQDASTPKRRGRARKEL